MEERARDFIESVNAFIRENLEVAIAICAIALIVCISMLVLINATSVQDKCLSFGYPRYSISSESYCIRIVNNTEEVRRLSDLMR